MVEFPITKVIGILLIIFAVFILLIFGGPALWKIGGAGLALIGFINYTEVDYTIINENAISTFDLLIRDVNKCQASKDNSCACEASFTGFFETHKLESDGNELRLINIKESNEITMKKEKIQGLNCYLDDMEIKKLDKLEIFFNEDLPYIPISGIFESNAEFAKDLNLKIYKSNELCWLTSKAELTNYNTCS
ncbi:MAG: hypothetical protein AABX55_02390 [Nanoarchaeota archaeon]